MIMSAPRASRAPRSAAFGSSVKSLECRELTPDYSFVTCGLPGTGAGNSA
jgi:hypothetical protein